MDFGYRNLKLSPAYLSIVQSGNSNVFLIRLKREINQRAKEKKTTTGTFSQIMSHQSLVLRTTLMLPDVLTCGGNFDLIDHERPILTLLIGKKENSYHKTGPQVAWLRNCGIIQAQLTSTCCTLRVWLPLVVTSSIICICHTSFSPIPLLLVKDVQFHLDKESAMEIRKINQNAKTFSSVISKVGEKLQRLAGCLVWKGSTCPCNTLDSASSPEHEL